MDVNKIQQNRRTQIKTALTKARNSLSGINLLALRSLPYKAKVFSRIIRQDVQPIYLPEHRFLVLDTLIEPLMAQYNDRLRVPPPPQLNKGTLDPKVDQRKFEIQKLRELKTFVGKKIAKYASEQSIAELYSNQALMVYAKKELDLSYVWVDARLEQDSLAPFFKKSLNRLQRPTEKTGIAKPAISQLFLEIYKDLKSLKPRLENRITALRSKFKEHQNDRKVAHQVLRHRTNYYDDRRLTPKKYRRNPHVMPQTRNDARRHNFINKLFGERSKACAGQAAEFLRDITAFEEPIQRNSARKRLFG